MKSCSCLVAASLFAALSTLPGLAQEQNADGAAALTARAEQAQPGNAEAATSTLKPGTFLVAEFSGGLNAGKLKPGDKVKAILTQELVAHGKVLAPEESRLIGHVTESRPHTPSEGESRLGIVFDKLLLKHHKELQFVATVYLLEPPSNRPSRVDQPSQMLPPSLMGPARSANPSAVAGRGTTSNAGRTTASAGPSANSISGMTQINAPVVVGGTPGTALGDKNVPANLPHTQSATNAPASAGKGRRPGVYGIKSIALGPRDSLTPGLVIVSKESTVKLEDGTQVVLMTMTTASVVASK